MSMRPGRGVSEIGAVINQEALPLPGHESILFATMKFDYDAAIVVQPMQLPTVRR
jgi:hypothetical protein